MSLRSLYWAKFRLANSGERVGRKISTSVRGDCGKRVTQQLEEKVAGSVGDGLGEDLGDREGLSPVTLTGAPLKSIFASSPGAQDATLRTATVVVTESRYAGRPQGMAKPTNNRISGVLYDFFTLAAALVQNAELRVEQAFLRPCQVFISSFGEQSITRSGSTTSRTVSVVVGSRASRGRGFPANKLHAAGKPRRVARAGEQGARRRSTRSRALLAEDDERTTSASMQRIRVLLLQVRP